MWAYGKLSYKTVVTVLSNQNEYGYRDILPTRWALLTKRVAMDNSCVFCSSPELALHVFSSCPFANRVYLAANMNPAAAPGGLT